MSNISRRTIVTTAWVAPVVVAAVSASAAAASGAPIINLAIPPGGIERDWLTFTVTLTGNLPAGQRTDFAWSVQGDSTVIPATGARRFPRAEGPAYTLWIPAVNKTGSAIDGILTVSAYGASASIPFRHPA